MRTSIRVVTVLLLLGAAIAASGDEEDSNGQPAAPTSTGEPRATSNAEKSSAAASSVPIYVPPDRGAPRKRISAGTRGPKPAPTVAVLAPDHVGLTRRAQPAFAWFVAEGTPLSAVLTITEEEAPEPLVEVPLPGPFEAGIHVATLAGRDARLEPGVTYQWSIALIVDSDQRDLDAVSSGFVRFEPAADSGSTSDYRALAADGVWYDAIAELSDAIAAQPDDATLRRHRVALLDQVGVGPAATFERRKF